MAVGAYDNHILLGVNSASFIQRVRYPEAETFELQIQETAGYSEDYFCLPHRDFWMLLGISNGSGDLCLANESFVLSPALSKN